MLNADLGSDEGKNSAIELLKTGYYELHEVKEIADMHIDPEKLFEEKSLEVLKDDILMNSNFKSYLLSNPYIICKKLDNLSNEERRN